MRVSDNCFIVHIVLFNLFSNFISFQKEAYKETYQIFDKYLKKEGVQELCKIKPGVSMSGSKRTLLGKLLTAIIPDYNESSIHEELEDEEDGDYIEASDFFSDDEDYEDDEDDDLMILPSVARRKRKSFEFEGQAQRKVQKVNHRVPIRSKKDARFSGVRSVSLNNGVKKHRNMKLVDVQSERKNVWKAQPPSRASSKSKKTRKGTSVRSFSPHDDCNSIIDGGLDELEDLFEGGGKRSSFPF